MKYFDSHAHYYDGRFEAETEEGADRIIGALLSGSVSAIINVGTSPETSRAAIEQAKADNIAQAAGQMGSAVSGLVSGSKTETPVATPTTTSKGIDNTLAFTGAEAAQKSYEQATQGGVPALPNLKKKV